MEGKYVFSSVSASSFAGSRLTPVTFAA